MDASSKTAINSSTVISKLLGLAQIQPELSPDCGSYPGNDLTGTRSLCVALLPFQINKILHLKEKKNLAPLLGYNKILLNISKEKIQIIILISIMKIPKARCKYHGVITGTKNSD